VVRPDRPLAALEGARADRVQVAAHEHRHRHLGLQAQPLLERAADMAHDRLLVGADRALRQLGDLVRELQRALERLAARDDLVDQADALGLVDVDAPAGRTPYLE